MYVPIIASSVTALSDRAIIIASEQHLKEQRIKEINMYRVYINIPFFLFTLVCFSVSTLLGCLTGISGISITKETIVIIIMVIIEQFFIAFEMNSIVKKVISIVLRQIYSFFA